MLNQLGLRTRFMLFFAALWMGGCVVLLGGLWFGFSRYGGTLDGYVTAGLLAVFGLLAITVWIGWLFDVNVARPIGAVSADLETRARTRVASDIDKDPAKYLGALAPAAQAIHDALELARTSQERALAEKTERMARDKALLEAIVRELADGVLAFSSEGRILLYNQKAVSVLGGVGLDRPLDRVLTLDPILDAANRLDETPCTAATFLTATREVDRLISGAVTAVAVGEERIGHVLIFRDTTEILRSHGTLEHLLGKLVENTRRPTMALTAILDVLDTCAPIDSEQSQQFHSAMRNELTALTDRLDEVAENRSGIANRHWPIAPTTASHIFEAVRMNGHHVRIPEIDKSVRCDGYAITALLCKLVAFLTENTNRSALEISTETSTTELRINLKWTGTDLSQGQLETWLNQPIADGYGTYTLQDALDAHHTDIWVEGACCIVLPLQLTHPETVPFIERPDFYDFNGQGTAAHSGPLGDQTYVVFDTETTGLDPNSDDVVQIAAVRIVRGRVVRGETFDSLVHPGRPIPAVSTSIHGITDAHVAGAPDMLTVGQDFARFAEGAVLVAHNAPFDMAFLHRLEQQGGPRFENPVLCTARLSLGIHTHTGEHTLDALADRFDVQIPEAHRHTALGDAIATAEIFLKMMPLLQADGASSLHAAMDLQGDLVTAAMTG